MVPGGSDRSGEQALADLEAGHPHRRPIRRWRDRRKIAQFVVEWNGLPVTSIKTAWKQAVERVYGKHDPDYQRDVANAFGAAQQPKRRVSLP